MWRLHLRKYEKEKVRARRVRTDCLRTYQRPGISDRIQYTARATYHTLATPTIALLKSSSVVIPSVAYSIAWHRQNCYYESNFQNVSNLAGALVLWLRHQTTVAVHYGLFATCRRGEKRSASRRTTSRWSEQHCKQNGGVSTYRLNGVVNYLILFVT